MIWSRTKPPLLDRVLHFMPIHRKPQLPIYEAHQSGYRFFITLESEQFHAAAKFLEMKEGGFLDFGQFIRFADALPTNNS